MRKLDAKEFEDLCLDRMQAEERLGRGTMGRYGVMAHIDIDPITKQVKWQPLKSLPDLEGIVPPMGQQFVTDCKVDSKGAVNLHASNVSELQIRHMLRRSRFGAVCFLLIHYNPRELKTKSDEAETFAFPVQDGHPFWTEFAAGGGKKSINRDDCRKWGVVVDWNLATEKSKTMRPDILNAVWRLREKELPPVLNDSAAADTTPG